MLPDRRLKCHRISVANKEKKETIYQNYTSIFRVIVTRDSINYQNH